MKRQRYLIGLVGIALAFAAIASLAGCTAPEDTRRTVEAYGFTDIEITGYRFTGCSERDAQHTGFRATDLQGRRISGVVCSNWVPWGKSNTLRID